MIEMQPMKPNDANASSLKAVAQDKEVFPEIVRLIAASREKAIQSVNTALIELYWEVGAMISRKIEAAEWGILVETKQAGDLFYRIGAMDFDLAVVGVAFGHYFFRPITRLSCEPFPACPPDHELRHWICLRCGRRSEPLLHVRARPRLDCPGSLAW
jgi:hypothetical protein